MPISRLHTQLIISQSDVNNNMFSLFHGIYRWFRSKNEMTVLIVGLDGAGKTTLLEQVKSLFKTSMPPVPLDKIYPTLGMNVAEADFSSCRVVFQDLGGHASVRSLWEEYYSGADGVIFVIDAAAADRYDEARETLLRVVTSQRLAGVPVLVLANKQDLPTSRLPTQLDVIDRAREVGVGGVRAFRAEAISALSCDGVKDAVDWIVKALQQ